MRFSSSRRKLEKIQSVLFIAVVALFSNQAQAVQCYLTVMKDDCWSKYAVKVVATDIETSKEVAVVEIPQGKSWGRASFECQAKESLNFNSSYTPVFWDSEKNKTYHALREWLLPESIKPGDTAWHIKLCYSAQFSEVPLPPEAKGHCLCHPEEVPPL